MHIPESLVKLPSLLAKTWKVYFTAILNHITSGEVTLLINDVASCRNMRMSTFNLDMDESKEILIMYLFLIISMILIK